MVWKNVSLALHIFWIRLVARLCVSKPHLNPVDIVQVFALDEKSLCVVAQITDSKAMLELAYLMSDQICRRRIYLLLILRIS